MVSTFSTTGGTSHSQSLTGLADGQSYNYYVRCIDNASNANTDDYQISFSVLSPGQTQDTSAPIISGVSASTVGINTATIVWITNEPSDSQVEYGTSTYDLLSQLDSSLATNHSVTLFGLKSNSTYNFRAKSRDGGGNLSISGNLTFTTGKTSGDVDPPVISDISASVTYASATVTWVTDESATSKVEYGSTGLTTGSLATSSQLYTASTTRDVILKKNHSVLLKSLQPRTKYNFRVISDDVVDNRAISGNFTFTTDRTPASLVPDPNITRVSVAAARSTSAKIEWRTNIPATSQIVFGEKSEELSESTLEQVTLTTTHSVTVTDLTPKTKYFFRAVSKNAADTATSSAVSSFETPSLEIQQLVDVSKPNAQPPGSPGTQTPKITAGETVTAVPILATRGDTTSPQIILFNFAENPTDDLSPTISGRAIDAVGVVASVSYSTDSGTSWHPVSQVTGIGTEDARFSATIPNLKDGNYPILFRAKDNSGNIGLSRTASLVIDQRPPSTGANALFLGTQSIVPSNLGAVQTISGIISKIVTTAVGGVTKIDVIATKRNGAEETPSSIFPLSYFKEADLWYGDIKISSPGIYDLKIKADDGTGQTSERTINPFAVTNPGIITDSKTGEFLEGASVSAHQFLKEQNKFVLWPGDIYTQENPQVTGSDGAYRFILPPGRYYLKIKAPGYKTLYTDIIEFQSHSILSFAIPLSEKAYIKIGRKKLHLPSLPDFSGSKRITTPAKIQVEQLAAVSSLINAPAPIFNLPDVKGEDIDLRYLRGKRTVLTVWSTWSPLAQAQVPVIDEVQKIEGDDARLLLISLQESNGTIDTYLRRGGYGVTGIVDSEGKFAESYPILTIPQHFFVDRRGVIRDIFVGFLSTEELLERIKQL